jgi:molybdopterin converting factor small subunit
MPSIRIPTPLRTYTNGQAEVFVSGDTVQDALENLIFIYPALRPHLFAGETKLRPFVNLFLGEANVRDLPQEMQTRLAEGDRLLMIPSIAGGSVKLPRRWNRV